MGGAFLRFTVGRVGASAAHVRYISRPAAVMDREAGVWLVGLPAEVTEAVSFADLRANLIAYAAVQEWIEKRTGRGARTHYKGLISFDTPVGREQAQALTRAWLAAALPQAKGAAFYHRNTAHGHVHVWLEARQTDGRKINLSAAAYRQLDEVWNRLWAEALGRDPEEHLAKKRATEAVKATRRAGRPGERPARAHRRLSPDEYQRRDREGVGDYELDSRGVGDDQPETALRLSPTNKGPELQLGG